MQPVIAMPQMGNSLFRKYMKSKYVSSLARSGAQVRWIPLEDPDLASKLVLECDGLLMPGFIKTFDQFRQEHTASGAVRLLSGYAQNSHNIFLAILNFSDI